MYVGSKDLTSQPKCGIKALHELTMSVCTDVVPATSKAFCTCHRGRLHDLGNKIWNVWPPWNHRLNWVWLELWQCIIFTMGKPSANCWIWGSLTKEMRPTTKIIGWQSRLFSNPQIGNHTYTHILVYKNFHSNHNIFTSFPHI